MRNFFEKLILLARYSGAGVAAFIFELLLLNLFLNILPGSLYLPVALAFSISIIFQYGACHWWVFKNSRRRVKVEYFYFMIILVSGLLLTLALVAAAVQLFAIPVLVARTLSGIFTGLWDFYLNARLNFRAHAFLRRR